MADNRIQLPQSGGGLIRYNEEMKSNFMMSPYVVMAFIALIIIGILFLHLLY